MVGLIVSQSYAKDAQSFAEKDLYNSKFKIQNHDK